MASSWVKPRDWDMALAGGDPEAELCAANDPLMEEPSGRA